ncbi:MAG: NAD(P)-binding protein, partial [Vicinamibacterales bacterium]
MAQERSVLIMGGGIAALAAAAALVEHNRDKAERTQTRFKITVLTSDDVWGGRASSWAGGGER